MPTFKVIRTYTYTTETFIECKSEEEAVDMVVFCGCGEEDINHDDSLEEYKVLKVR